MVQDTKNRLNEVFLQCDWIMQDTKNGLDEVFLQCECIGTWKKCGGSCFTKYTTYVTPNYKTRLFVEQGNYTHRHYVKTDHIICHPNHCFHMIWFTLVSM